MKSKTALVTGASRGIGRAIAIGLAKEGYDLILTCLHSDARLQALSRELACTYGISCDTFLGNLGEEAEVDRLFAGIKQLEVLVNNAGISYIGLLQDMRAEEWRQVMAVNLDSCFYTCRRAIPLMLRQEEGRILNISSVWGYTGASMEVAYSASKGALNAFTRALARELAPSGIPVNAIACGLIDTDMNRCYLREELETICDEIPAGRMGTPEEVAALAVRLLTAPTYLTGQIVALDGGWT